MIEATLRSGATVVRIAQRRVRVLVGVLVALTGGLVLSNPGPSELEDFAGLHLVELIDKEICQKPGLPLLLRLVITDCSTVVRSQQHTLGRLAREHSQRLNLGVASVYSTTLGGDQVLPNWQVPRYSVTTLAVAGHFVVLKTSTDPSPQP